MKKIPVMPIIIGGIFTLSLAVIIATSFLLKKDLQHEQKLKLEGTYKTRNNAEFVGSSTCKNCHERTYLNWRTSLHSRMMRDVTLEPTANFGDFESASSIRNFTRKDVSYTLGSQWKQMYLKKQGENITVLPAEYIVNSGEWTPYLPDDPEKRDWIQECAGCHTTGFNPKTKSFVEMGIGCEACHGPGSNHVEAVPGYEINTIMQAGRLTPAQGAQICGSCHTRGRDKKGGYAYPFSYQKHKGEANLRLHFEEVQKNNGHESKYFWPSGESRYSNQQYLDWKQSEHAKVGVTCVTCHSVHKRKTSITTEVDTNNLLTAISAKTRLFGDQLCKSCHKSPQRRSVHRIHTYGSCIRCHMPKVAQIGEAGDAHSHTFDFMSPLDTIKYSGLEKQPNACNTCHHHKKTSPETLAGFLEAAKKNDMPKPFTVHKTDGK